MNRLNRQAWFRVIHNMMARLIQHYRCHFLFWEGMAAWLLGLGLIVWAERFGGREVFLSFLHKNRSQFYGTIASLSGTLLGFVIAAASIILALVNTRRLSLLRDSAHYRTLWAIYLWSIRSLAVATAVSVATLFFDRDDKPLLPLAYVLLCVLIWAAVTFLRTLWSFERIIQIVTAKSPERKAPEA